MIRLDVEGLVLAITGVADNVRASVGERELRAVGFAGAEVFRDEAKRNALSHLKTGTIYRNIIVKRIEEQSSTNLFQTYKVTVRQGDYGGGDAFYWRFVEHGHRFVPRNKRISKRTGKKIAWKGHRLAAELEYGTASSPAYPFMRPAYSSKQQQAIDVMTKTLAEQLKRYLGGS